MSLQLQDLEVNKSPSDTIINYVDVAEGAVSPGTDTGDIDVYQIAYSGFFLIHMDLTGMTRYSKSSKDAMEFAPFSHDADAPGAPIPRAGDASSSGRRARRSWPRREAARKRKGVSRPEVSRFVAHRRQGASPRKSCGPCLDRKANNRGDGGQHPSEGFHGAAGSGGFSCRTRGVCELLQTVFCGIILVEHPGFVWVWPISWGKVVPAPLRTTPILALPVQGRGLPPAGIRLRASSTSLEKRRFRLTLSLPPCPEIPDRDGEDQGGGNADIPRPQHAGGCPQESRKDHFRRVLPFPGRVCRPADRFSI